MKSKEHQRKKTSIFRIFLIPLILIMLIQSMITIGTLVVRRTAGILQEYSGSMMNRLVENRRVILQNDMNQRWASVNSQEVFLNHVLEQYLEERHVEIEEFLESDRRKSEFLNYIFPEFIDILQNSSTTGIFLIITGTDMQAEGDHDGFYIRDSDPDTRPVNNTDLLLERGSKELSREWNIPLK